MADLVGQYVADDEPFAEWGSRVAGGYTLGVPSSPRRPNLLTDALNGHSVSQLVGADDHQWRYGRLLGQGALNYVTAEGMTFFGVMRCTIGPEIPTPLGIRSRMTLQTNSDAAPSWGGQVELAVDPYMEHDILTVQVASDSGLDGGLWTTWDDTYQESTVEGIRGSWHVYDVSVDLDSGLVVLGLDGETVIAELMSSAASVTVNQLYIDNSWDIAELRFYNGPMNADERAAVAAVLKATYLRETPTLKARYAATNGVNVSSGDQVTSWNSTVAGTSALLTPGITRRPTLVHDQLDGRPVLRLEGDQTQDDQLYRQSFGRLPYFDHNVGGTIMALVRPTVTTGSGRRSRLTLRNTLDGNNEGWFASITLEVSDPGIPSWMLVTAMPDAGGSGDGFHYVQGDFWEEWILLTFTVDAITGVADTFVDGQQVLTMNSGAGAYSFNVFWFDNCWDIAELRFYDGPLNTVERETAEGEIHQQWLMPLAPNEVHSVGSPGVAALTAGFTPPSDDRIQVVGPAGLTLVQASHVAPVAPPGGSGTITPAPSPGGTWAPSAPASPTLEATSGMGARTAWTPERGR